MKNFFPRLISGIIYAALIFAGTTIHPYGLIGLLFFFCVLTLSEYLKITKIQDKLYKIGTFVAVLILFYIFGKDFLEVFNMNQSFGIYPFFINSMAFAAPVLFLFSVFIIFFSSKELLNDFGKATIAVTYIILPFALSLTLPSFGLNLGENQMHYEVLFVFILLWVSDSFAYIFGSLFGKHPMAPKISQAKSWEGFTGGLVGTILAGFIIEQYIDLPLQGNWIIIGLIIAFTAPLGDLTESKFKRFFKVKDSGNLIPGHGGFLDRLDSYIFVVPFVYTYFLLINGL